MGKIAVIYGLVGRPSDSSQAAFLTFGDIAEAIPQPVHAYWSLFHMRIEGNEAADREAGEGAKGTDLNLPPTLAAARAVTRKALRNAFPE